MDEGIFSFAREHGLKPERVTDASSGINPLGPSRKVKAAVRKAVRKIGMQPDPGHQVLKRFFSSRCGISPDSICFFASSRELVSEIAMVLGPSRMLSSQSAHEGHGSAASRCGAELLQIPLSHHNDIPAPDLALLKGMIRRGDLAVLSNPDRMTGRLLEDKALSDLLDSSASAGATVVIDESLIEFAGDEYFCIRGARPGCITVRTTAYYYGVPGLELACAVSEPSVISALEMGKCDAMGVLAVEAARAAFRDKAFRRQTGLFMAAEKTAMMRRLKRTAGITVYDSDTNVFAVRLDERMKGLAEALAGAGFLIGSCNCPTEDGNSVMTLSVMSRDMNRKFLRVVSEYAARMG